MMPVVRLFEQRGGIMESTETKKKHANLVL